MNQFQTAADEIRRVAKLYQPFVQAAEILDAAGSLENASKEAQASRDKAVKAADKAKADKAKAAKAKAASLVRFGTVP